MKRSSWSNPFFLMAQGFVVGAFLFFATTQQSGEAKAQGQAASSPLIEAGGALPAY